MQHVTRPNRFVRRYKFLPPSGRYVTSCRLPCVELEEGDESMSNEGGPAGPPVGTVQRRQGRWEGKPSPVEMPVPMPMHMPKGESGYLCSVVLGRPDWDLSYPI